MNIGKRILKGFLLSAVMLLFTEAYSQDIQVSGKVIDSKDNTPMIGVSVVVKGTTIGTITDIDGNFSIKSPVTGTLVFSFLGYKTQEVPVNGQARIELTLQEETQQIDEVIVIGYGVQKKSDRTGAVYNVKSEELNRGMLSDPIQSMMGKVAGVNVSKKGGDPNAGFSVQIRGAAGFFSSTQPLYVVDGVPGVDPTTISPDEIESFNILKDASSGAIYGSRASNGVIIITTKKANAKIKEPTIDYNTYLSRDVVANRLDLLSASDIRKYVQDKSILNFTDNGANTDWQDEIFRTAWSHSHNIAVSNSTDNLSYRLSYNYFNNQGVVINSNKERNIVRLNLSQKALNNKLTVDASISGTFENNQMVNYGNGMSSSNIFYHTYLRNPTDPVYKYNTDGLQDKSLGYFEFQREFNYNNPVALANLIQNERDAKKYFGTAKISFEITKELLASTNLSYIRDDDEKFYYEPTNIYAVGNNGFGQRRYSNFNSKLLETTLNYSKTLNDSHNISLLGGYSFQEDYNSGINAQGRDALSDYLASNNLSHLLTFKIGEDISSWRGKNRLISFFGRATYNYQSKYFATFTLRRDGSSKFGQNNEWGIFPSGSIAWDAKKEKFLDNIDLIDQLKLRVGYGVTGNQEFGSYNDLMYFRTAGSIPNIETGEPAINFELASNANPDLKWEENSELNIGVDFALFRNRIQGSIEYYSKSTYDLLGEFSVPVPPYAAKNIWANVGQVDNKGFEFFVQTFVIDNKTFNWKTSFNFATNKQKIASLEGEKFSWSEDSRKRMYLSGRGMVGVWSQYLKPGQEIGSFYMPEFAGISSDGQFLFYTAAGGVTREPSAAEIRNVGKALPSFTLGWSNVFNYKGFDASISIRAAYGNKVLNSTRMNFGNTKYIPNLNMLSEVLDMINDGFKDDITLSSYYLEDGSFIKIDNLTLGYNLDKVSNKLVKKIRLYLSFNNLHTFTKYKGGDPEMTYSGLEFGLDQFDVYPKSRSITFGFDIKF